MTSKIETTDQIGAEVNGKLFFEAKIRNTSPLAISNGDSIFSDADIHRDVNHIPMIPATSIMGALKSYMETHVDMENTEIFHYLMGHNDHHGKVDNSIQSHLMIDDLICSSDEIKTNVRDGVRINPATNLAEDQGKYDYEILEPGHEFSLSGEVTIRGGICEKEILDFLSLIQYIINTKKVKVGSLTSFNFGELSCDNFQHTGELREEPYFTYLKSLNKEKKAVLEGYNVDDSGYKFKELSTLFSFDLSLSTPLFIGGGTADTYEADDASLKSGDNYILSAKSMKGAVRHHAYRIANTMHDEKIAEWLTDKIFGNNTHQNNKPLSKSKFTLGDGKIENAGETKPHTRVAINRFTGATMNTALFASEPVWPKKETSVNIAWQLENMKTDNDVAVGLLLLVARDLLTERLPIGGDKAIGRGRFRGTNCNVTMGEITYTIEMDPNNPAPTIHIPHEADALNKYVSAFINYQNTAQ